MPIAQVAILILFLGVVGFFVLRGMSKMKTLGGSVQPGLDALSAGFLQSRSPDESEPVCVVAFHCASTAQQVTVGVTNKRILVVKGSAPLLSFPYDEQGEHLPSAQKKAQGRGFFEWSHGTFKDGSTGYSPTVKPPPFAGEEWRMYPTIQGFPQQTANLREFSNRFYFQWFYD